MGRNNVKTNTMDGRINNGGNSTKSTKENDKRKIPYEDRVALVTKLTALDDEAFKCLERGIKKGDYNFWNKFMEYRYGKPVENHDITTNGSNISIPIVKFVE